MFCTFKPCCCFDFWRATHFSKIFLERKLISSTFLQNVWSRTLIKYFKNNFAILASGEKFIFEIYFYRGRIWGNWWVSWLSKMCGPKLFGPKLYQKLFKKKFNGFCMFFKFKRSIFYFFLTFFFFSFFLNCFGTGVIKEEIAKLNYLQMISQRREVTHQRSIPRMSQACVLCPLHHQLCATIR